MFDLISRPASVEPLHREARAAYVGPERRSTAMDMWTLIAAAIDELDYGLLLLDAELHPFHLNAAAQQALAEGDLMLRGRTLGARRPHDQAALHAALRDALDRGRRRLLHLGEPGNPSSVSVIPIAGAAGGKSASVLVVLGRRRGGAALAVEGFARNHRLSCGETRVLRSLCEGERPSQAARRHGVALSTVRTQISSIRAKTGAASIPDLLGRIAALPPMMCVLRMQGAAPIDTHSDRRAA